MQPDPRQTGQSPTTEPAATLSPALSRNIEALVERRAREAREAPLEDKIAALIGDFAGSMLFVYIHLALFGGWILINTGVLPVLPAWDPSLVILAMAASVEAIFLSTFVLITQNRMAAADSARADLDLQVSLLNEHETTRLLVMVEAIAKKLGVEAGDDTEIDELKRDIAPEAVLDRIEDAAEDES